jgi:two-component system, chemotaxis family, sensor kinase CheA
MDDLLREFLTETGEHLETVDAELVRFEQEPEDAAILRNVFRLVHTIKGTCGFLGLPRLEALAHAAETLMGKFREGMPVTRDAVTLILATLDRIKAILAELERSATEPDGSDRDLIGSLEDLATSGPGGQARDRGSVSLEELERAFCEAPGPDAVAPDVRDSEERRPADRDHGLEGPDALAIRAQTIRVNVGTLEHLMTMVSELVLTRNQLLEISRNVDDARWKAPLQRLSQVTAELQDGVMKTRMQPIGHAWQKLPRVVRDLCAELAKKIELVAAGADTELDRQVLELVKDPLTHMVRNAADHAIETPAERRAAGKPEHGTIRLAAFHEGGTITIEIADDGRGLDYAAIRRKAVDRGLVGEADADRLSEAQLAKFIFHPGFSTARAITSVSGRGVGMDVVKSNIELIGGTVEIRSRQGQGTTFTIKIPLTLAIVAALIVRVKDQRFAIPQASVLELLRVAPGTDHAIERIDGTPIVRLRDRLLPIVPLAEVLDLTGREADRQGFVVVTQVGRQRFGLLVDKVLHTEEIVVKPMASKLRDLQLFSGNTILGDGAVVLIVDPNGLARALGTGAGDPRLLIEETVAPPVQGDATALLVFRGAREGFKAVPLSLVARLEEIDASRIEWLAGRPVVQYRGRLMPLVPADDALDLRREGPRPLVVVSDGERTFGLAVEDIVDVVEDRPHVEPVGEGPGAVSSAVIRGRATEIVDLGPHLPLAGGDLSPMCVRGEAA